MQDKTKGDVIMSLIPLIANFEAAKNAIKVKTDAEQKIVDSYQVNRHSSLHTRPHAYKLPCCMQYSKYRELE